MVDVLQRRTKSRPTRSRPQCARHVVRKLRGALALSGPRRRRRTADSVFARGEVRPELAGLSHRQTRSFAGANSFSGPGGGSKRALAFPSERRRSDTIMKTVERRCKRCAMPLPPSMARAAKFCSHACRIRYWHFRRRLERIARHREQDRQCARCGEPIFWLRSDARYCSTQCRQVHHQRRKREASSRRHVSPPA